MMSPSEIRTAISGLSPAFLKQLGINSLYVFGSVARGEAGVGSDVDIIVDFEGPATFDGYMALKEQLEELLGAPVDLVTRSALRPELKARIEGEAVRVA